MQLGYLFSTILKMAALIAWIYGLMWGLKHKLLWQKALTVILAFAVIQAVFLIQFGDFALFSAFDQGLLFQAVSMAMVALGLNLIYGFNGQFSLAQWSFYGIGAYCAADITYRWTNGDPTGLLILGFGVVLAAIALVGVGRLLRLKRGIPVLSAFTFYLVAIVAAGLIAVFAGRALAPALIPLFGTTGAPGGARLRSGPTGGVLPLGFDRRRLRGRSELPLRTAGADPGERLFRNCNPGLCHRGADPHGELRHDPSLPRDEGRSRHDRDPEDDVVDCRIRLPVARHRHRA